MSREVAVRKLGQDGAEVSEPECLTPEEWIIVRFYRGLGEPDRMMMRRMLSALAAIMVPD
jgi:hypothetical protein